MAYIKFKELTKYFDFRLEVDTKNLPEYTIEYLNANEDVLLAYKNSRDYALFTGERMILFDRDALGLYYKKIHIIPYNRISTCAINFKPGKVELLCSLDSGCLHTMREDLVKLDTMLDYSNLEKDIIPHSLDLV